MAASRDRERAAAIGNTEALGKVLRRETASVAAERANEADDGSSWASELSAESYAPILGAFLMKLIDNERTHATERGVAIHDMNANALAQAVQQVRQG